MGGEEGAKLFNFFSHRSRWVGGEILNYKFFRLVGAVGGGGLNYKLFRLVGVVGGDVFH